MTWQPIKTAPLDRDFLVRNETKDQFAVAWNSYSCPMTPSGVDCESHYRITFDFKPFEWMEIPE